MNFRNISPDELKAADEFQQKILNPKNEKRYRPFSYIKRQYGICPELFVGVYKNNKIIGIAFGYVKKSNVLLGELAIDQKFRKMGIGSKLLVFFENRAARIGKEKIVTGALEEAEAFYLRKGYKPILFLQIKYSQLPQNYTSISEFKIIKETNYVDAKRLFFEVKEPSKQLKVRLINLFHAYDGIYLFEKKLS